MANPMMSKAEAQAEVARIRKLAEERRKAITKEADLQCRPLKAYIRVLESRERPEQEETGDGMAT